MKKIIFTTLLKEGCSTSELLKGLLARRSKNTRLPREACSDPAIATYPEGLRPGKKGADIGPALLGPKRIGPLLGQLHAPTDGRAVRPKAIVVDGPGILAHLEELRISGKTMRGQSRPECHLRIL